MKITYEHYRVPERYAPLIPRAKHTQAAIDDMCERYDDAYRAEFQVPPEYRKPDGPMYRDGFAPHTHGGKTVCKVWNEKEIVAIGTAWCSINDPFSYHIGREIARGRAMKAVECLERARNED